MVYLDKFVDKFFPKGTEYIHSTLGVCYNYLFPVLFTH